ncbi:uncharacterized protein LOC114278441 [Camellia sinensis]|uniref:uncharacterized protein LOC114278441 n=1 Tax=Camellia sinensis TaxID=4442 RepID=UPI001036CD60|nr:uncharacterized protein LOC114278441 [Camellia sinensis]
MESLMQRINEHIHVEDDSASATEKANSVATDRRMAGKVHSVGQENNSPNDWSKDQRRGWNRDDRNKGRRNDRANAPRDEEEDAKRKLKVRTGITTVFKIPIYHILSEIRARHLDQYIDRGMKAAPLGQTEPNGLAALDAAPQGVINVIYGITEPERVYELRGMIKKAEHMREVLSVQLAVKKGKTEEKDILSFSGKDLERIQVPHNDALVVTLRVKDFDIKRILID